MVSTRKTSPLNFKLLPQTPSGHPHLDIIKLKQTQPFLLSLLLLLFSAILTNTKTLYPFSPSQSMRVTSASSGPHLTSMSTKSPMYCKSLLHLQPDFHGLGSGPPHCWTQTIAHSLSSLPSLPLDRQSTESSLQNSVSSWYFSAQKTVLLFL